MAASTSSMAASTSNEIIYKFPEWQVNSFDVDYSGQLAVLAVQKWLAVIGLDHPSGCEFGSGDGRVKAKRKLGTHNKYETKALHWNPTSHNSTLLASTNHQKIDVWDISEGKTPFVSIKAHTRPVSDISWSSSDQNLLASCAVDSYVHIWDIRDIKRPKVSFKTLGGLNSGASLVQWNKSNQNVLASAHDSDVRIWDMKKPATVSACISAHMNKIHDIDWSFKTEKHLTTCSHDGTVKFWDVQSHREPQSTIKAGTHPIWRARNYPLGRGVAFALVPAVHSGDRRVFIYSRTNLSSPVAIMNQHSDAVTDLQWRRHNGDCELMSLSKDKTLRILSLSDQLQHDLDTDMAVDSTYFNIDHPKGKSLTSSHDRAPSPITKTNTDPDMSLGKLPNNTSANSLGSGIMFGAITSTPSSKSSLASGVTSSLGPSLPSTPPLTNNSSSSLFSPSPSDTLAHEFNLLTDIDNLEVERLEPADRSCTVRLEQGPHVVRMQITFPSHYPNGAVPNFTIDPTTTTIELSSRQELYKVVNEAASANVRMNRPCLEICLRKLAKTFESALCRPDPPPPKVQQDFDIQFGKLDDDRIPFPRTSGARFCANGMLVCFSCPMFLGPDTLKTPKSLDMLNTSHNKSRIRLRQAALHGSTSLPKRGSGSNLQSYLQIPTKSSSPKFINKEGPKERVSKRTGDSFSQYYTATIYDAGSLLPISYDLAKAYSLAGNSIKEICTKNASVASSHNRPDLVQAWNTIYLIVSQSTSVPSGPDEDTPWPMHPFGRQLLSSLFSHYAKLYDVQTVAMLACICQLQCQQVDDYFFNKLKPVLPPLTLTPQVERKLHSSSDSFGDWVIGYPDHSPAAIVDMDDTNHDELVQHHINCRLLDESMIVRCNEYRRAYADILYRWSLLTQRSEVIKYQSTGGEFNKENILISLCKTCHMRLEKPFCSRCGEFALKCVICNIAVKGCGNLCLNCGHGGHTHHLMDWFTNHTLCPSGCGCSCLETSGWSQ